MKLGWVHILAAFYTDRADPEYSSTATVAAPTAESDGGDDLERFQRLQSEG